MEANKAAKNALKHVLKAKKGEKITIFCDETKAQIGEAFKKGAQSLELETKLILLDVNIKRPRQEIPVELDEHLTTQRANIYINLLEGNREETTFRIKLIHKETDDKQTRLGHCPGVTLDMLSNGALALSEKEHKKMQTFAKDLIKRLENAIRMEITTQAGTKLSLSVKNRHFFTDTVVDWELMKWMNLPTGEVIVAPIEDSLEGKLVCDAAIGGIGPVEKPVIIKVKKGKVDAVTSENSQVLKRVQDSLHTDLAAKVVGEFAFGINPKARFGEEFLETEKMQGTIHIAFGDNSDMPGGKNSSANHMDFMMHKPTVNAINKDGSIIKILVNGEFQPIITENEQPHNLQDEEKLPVSEIYRIINHITIYKTDLWWEAIVIFEMYNKRQIGLYLWQKRNGQWKRKHKFGIRNTNEWMKIKNAIEELLPKMAENNQPI
ncbi:MAG: aminopeptidase [Crenarchaeota archaeon]|nr:aminopeptidase [Thermoproteota archaeon]